MEFKAFFCFCWDLSQKGQKCSTTVSSSAFWGPLEQTNKVKTKLTSDLESVFIDSSSQRKSTCSQRGSWPLVVFFKNKASLRTFPLEQLRKEQENKEQRKTWPDEQMKETRLNNTTLLQRWLFMNYSCFTHTHTHARDKCWLVSHRSKTKQPVYLNSSIANALTLEFLPL